MGILLGLPDALIVVVAPVCGPLVALPAGTGMEPSVRSLPAQADSARICSTTCCGLTAAGFSEEATWTVTGTEHLDPGPDARKPCKLRIAQTDFMRLLSTC